MPDGANPRGAGEASSTREADVLKDVFLPVAYVRPPFFNELCRSIASNIKAALRHSETDDPKSLPQKLNWYVIEGCSGSGRTTASRELLADVMVNFPHASKEHRLSEEEFARCRIAHSFSEPERPVLPRLRAAEDYIGNQDNTASRYPPESPSETTRRVAFAKSYLMECVQSHDKIPLDWEQEYDFCELNFVFGERKWGKVTSTRPTRVLIQVLDGMDRDYWFVEGLLRAAQEALMSGELIVIPVLIGRGAGNLGEIVRATRLEEEYGYKPRHFNLQCMRDQSDQLALHTLAEACRVPLQVGQLHSDLHHALPQGFKRLAALFGGLPIRLYDLCNALKSDPAKRCDRILGEWFRALTKDQQSDYLVSFKGLRHFTGATLLSDASVSALQMKIEGLVACKPLAPAEYAQLWEYIHKHMKETVNYCRIDSALKCVTTFQRLSLSAKKDFLCLATSPHLIDPELQIQDAESQGPHRYIPKVAVTMNSIMLTGAVTWEDNNPDMRSKPVRMGLSLGEMIAFSFTLKDGYFRNLPEFADILPRCLLNPFETGKGSGDPLAVLAKHSLSFSVHALALIKLDEHSRHGKAPKKPLRTISFKYGDVRPGAFLVGRNAAAIAGATLTVPLTFAKDGNLKRCLAAGNKNDSYESSDAPAHCAPKSPRGTQSAGPSLTIMHGDSQVDQGVIASGAEDAAGTAISAGGSPNPSLRHRTVIATGAAESCELVEWVTSYPITHDHKGVPLVRREESTGELVASAPDWGLIKELEEGAAALEGKQGSQLGSRTEDAHATLTALLERLQQILPAESYAKNKLVGSVEHELYSLHMKERLLALDKEPTVLSIIEPANANRALGLTFGDITKTFQSRNHPFGHAFGRRSLHTMPKRAHVQDRVTRILAMGARRVARIFLILPPETWEHVLAFLRPHEEFPAACVCKAWYAILRRRVHLRGESIWRTWIGCALTSVSMMRWARETGLQWTDDFLCALIAEKGALDVLQWVREDGCPWSSETCVGAARGGHLALLQWARAEGCGWNEDVCCTAAGRGHFAFLQWARENGCPWDKRTCDAAARWGHLAMLQWAREKGCRWDADVCSLAAAGGHLQLLQWARAEGCPWDERACSEAARSGHLSVLEWARESGCAWGEDTCTAAASGGHLSVLRWAREHGCEWSVWTCQAAAYAGSLEVLKWARENGCPCDDRTCKAAAQRGHLQVLQWAVENGCPWNPADILSSTGDARVQQWIGQYL